MPDPRLEKLTFIFARATLDGIGHFHVQVMSSKKGLKRSALENGSKLITLFAFFFRTTLQRREKC